LFHLFFSLVLQVGGNCPQKIPQCSIALRFTTAQISAELSSTMGARRIAAMPECDAFTILSNRRSALLQPACAVTKSCDLTEIAARKNEKKIKKNDWTVFLSCYSSRCARKSRFVVENFRVKRPRSRCGADQPMLLPEPGKAALAGDGFRL
jgi:hypothetical protein